MNFEQLKIAAGACAAGAALCAFVGFSFGGWETAGSAHKIGEEMAEAAVHQALTPVCRAAFFRLPDAKTRLVALKSKSLYDRNEMVDKLVDIPGQESLDYDLSGACADAILSSVQKKAQK